MLSSQNLDRIDRFLEIVEKTKNPESNGVFVFKHSTRCFVSKMVYDRLASEWNLSKDIPFYYVDLLKYRDLSNTISNALKVHHESPQLLYIRNGECKDHASHSEVSADLANKMVSSQS